MKRTFVLLTVITTLVAAWIGGWFFVAGKVETAIADAKTRLERNNHIFECDNQEVAGFPFRISLFCDRVSYANARTGVSLEMSELRTAAQAYQPGKAVVEVDSPAVLTLPANEKLQTEWASMRASVSAGLSGPDNFSVLGKDLEITPEIKNRPKVNIGNMQIHGRRSGDDDVDFAVGLQNTVAENQPWPEFDANINLHINGVYTKLLQRTSLLEIARTNGLNGDINTLEYVSKEGGKLLLNGTAEIDRNGILTGSFNVTISEMPKLLDALGRAFPQRQNEISQASSAIGLLGKGIGKSQIKLPLTVKNGRVILGIIPLGKIPPLY